MTTISGLTLSPTTTLFDVTTPTATGGGVLPATGESWLSHTIGANDFVNPSTPVLIPGGGSTTMQATHGQSLSQTPTVVSVLQGWMQLQDEERETVAAMFMGKGTSVTQQTPAQPQPILNPVMDTPVTNAATFQHRMDAAVAPTPQRENEKANFTYENPFGLSPEAHKIRMDQWSGRHEVVRRERSVAALVEGEGVYDPYATLRNMSVGGTLEEQLDTVPLSNVDTATVTLMVQRALELGATVRAPANPRQLPFLRAPERVFTGVGEVSGEVPSLRFPAFVLYFEQLRGRMQWPLFQTTTLLIQHLSGAARSDLENWGVKLRQSRGVQIGSLENKHYRVILRALYMRFWDEPARDAAMLMVYGIKMGPTETFAAFHQRVNEARFGLNVPVKTFVRTLSHDPRLELACKVLRQDQMSSIDSVMDALAASWTTPQEEELSRLIRGGVSVVTNEKTPVVRQVATMDPYALAYHQGMFPFPPTINLVSAPPMNVPASSMSPLPIMPPSSTGEMGFTSAAQNFETMVQRVTSPATPSTRPVPQAGLTNDATVQQILQGIEAMVQRVSQSNVPQKATVQPSQATSRPPRNDKMSRPPQFPADYDWTNHVCEHCRAKGHSYKRCQVLRDALQKAAPKLMGAQPPSE